LYVALLDLAQDAAWAMLRYLLYALFLQIENDQDHYKKMGDHVKEFDGHD
jgi:hypothetical protein